MRIVAPLQAVAVSAFLLAASCTAGPPYRQLTLEELRDAEGWYHLPSFRYRGELSNGLPNGEGVALYPNGVRVASRFMNGVANGTARVEVPNFGTYVGEIAAGRLVRGELTKSNGEYYRGYFREWQPEGAGVLVRADGSRYAGEFKAGVPDGRGVSYNPATGTMIDGQFSAGVPDGRALVSRGGEPSIADYMNGRDVTAARIAKRSEELALAPLDRAVAAARNEAESERVAVNRVKEDVDRLATSRTRAGVERYNKACFCIRKAHINSDGSVYFTGDGCLEIVDRNAPPRTAAQKALDEQRENARRRSCNEWARDIEDPNMPQRLASMQEEFGRRQAALANALQRQRDAEAERARMAEELKAREQSARVREIAARVAAENAAEARAREADFRKRCADSNCCYCVLPTATVKSASSCAPCQ